MTDIDAVRANGRLRVYERQNAYEAFIDVATDDLETDPDAREA